MLSDQLRFAQIATKLGADRGGSIESMTTRAQAAENALASVRAEGALIQDAEQSRCDEGACLFHTNCWITMEAAAGCVPPASGVIVSAVVFSFGLRISIVEFATVVVTSASPEI